jgi:stage III sporulation protein SpoIIIAA
MKILLITLPRTGSTSLLKNLSEQYHLKAISEPFNSSIKNTEQYKNFDWNIANDICVKTHINHKDISFYLNFVKLFNKVILVSRKDLKLCAESLSYSNYFGNFSEKYEWVNTPNLMHNIKLVKKFDNDLKTLSELIDVNILYYEDLFDMNSENKLRKNDIKRKNLI